jgi:hypothetical protein
MVLGLSTEVAGSWRAVCRIFGDRGVAFRFLKLPPRLLDFAASIPILNRRPTRLVPARRACGLLAFAPWVCEPGAASLARCITLFELPEEHSIPHESSKN